MPKIDNQKYAFDKHFAKLAIEFIFGSVYDFLKDGWRHWILATLFWLVLLGLFLLSFQPLGN